jgi:acyl-CoA thioesterase I
MILAPMLSLLSTTVHAAEPMKPLSPEKGKVLRVACVGDSITQGSGADPGKSYPSQLQEILGEGWEVGNFGVSGRTLLRKGDFPYWKEAAYQKALGFKPDAVIIMLGTNDTKPQNWVHKGEFDSDYRDLVKSFQDLKPVPRVYICRPVPVPDGGNYGINEAGIQEQMPILAKLAEDLETGTIDMYGALDGKPKLLPDRVHPNTEGAGEMAKAAAKVLTGKTPRD